jgi:rsbT co-antagonist protein RsbR
MENKIGELIETTVKRFDGTTVEVELYCHPVKFGETKAIQSIIRDITSRKDAERKLRKIMNKVATPIVPVSQGIAVLPLIGSINEERANQLLDILPAKVQNCSLDYLMFLEFIIWMKLQ